MFTMWITITMLGVSTLGLPILMGIDRLRAH